MKTRTLTILFAALLAGGANAQEGSLKRSLIFKLNDNERVRQYFVLPRGDKNLFGCITTNEFENRDTLLMNGQRVAIGDNARFYHLDPGEENGQVIEYGKRGERYLNARGTVHGPFDDIMFAKDDNGDLDLDKFCYYRWREGRDSVYVHDHGRLDGPFEHAGFVTGEEGVDYAYLRDGQWRDHYRDGRDEARTRLECYQHKTDGKVYVNVNGRDEGEGHQWVSDLTFTESGHYAYLYSNHDEKWRVVIDGVESEEYDWVGDLSLAESGRYIYAYRKDNRLHVNMNGVVSRGYEEYGSYQCRVFFVESGKYAYAYVENGQWHVNINGQESRGYRHVFEIRLTESGQYAYSYIENGKVHVNVNGRESRGYNLVFEIRLTDSGQYAYWFDDDKGSHVNVNGEESPAINVMGAPVRHWLLITDEGKYAYTREKKGRWYVNINGKESEEYDRVMDLELAPNGDYSYYYENDEGRIIQNVNGKESETGYLAGMWTGKIPMDQRFAATGPHLFGSHWRLELYSPGREHSLLSSGMLTEEEFERNHVVIDGKIVGHKHANHAYYDKEKHAFVWSVLEGRELVLYEYKLD
jgi:hypothetical protein